MTEKMVKLFIFLLAAASIKNSISAPAPTDPLDPFDGMETEPTTHPSIPVIPIIYQTEGIEPIYAIEAINLPATVVSGMAEPYPEDEVYIPPPTTVAPLRGKASKINSVSKSVTITKKDGEVVTKSHSNAKGAPSNGTDRSVATAASTSGGDPNSKSVAVGKATSIVKKNGDTIIRTVAKSFSKGERTSGSSTATGSMANDNGTTTQSDSASTSGDGKVQKSVVKTITKITSSGEVTQVVKNPKEGKIPKKTTNKPSDNNV